ncbi:MAG: hypothetical protein U0174_17525 [Polyangiaceae bacterium]
MRRSGFRELDFGVFEVEVAVPDALKALLVDEEHGRRIESSGAIVVLPEVRGKGVRVFAQTECEERAHVLPVISDVTEYEVCGVGQ